MDIPPEATGIVVSTDGLVQYTTANDPNLQIAGQIQLANFANPEGLTRVGKNLLQKSNESGEPIVGKADTGTLGAVQSGSLELSTVDVANEFVKLIKFDV